MPSFPIFHFETGSLDAFARRSDCFRDAVATIRGICRSGDPGENERVRGTTGPITSFKAVTYLYLIAAILMTLCELATARHSFAPLECTAVTDLLETTGDQRMKCVE